MAILISKSTNFSHWRLLSGESISSVPRQNYDIEILIPTYNHEMFIRTALFSALAQETSARVGILIHDDASTDGTVALILASLAETGSNFDVTVLEESENQFSKKEGFYKQLLINSNSTFLSILDGDDYWYSKAKLQKQFEVMQDNPDIDLTFHDYFVKNPKKKWGLVHPHLFAQQKAPFWLLALENHVGTLTTMIRVDSLKAIEWKGYGELAIGDFPLWALLSVGNKSRYVPTIKAVYRQHSSNMTSPKTWSRIQAEIRQSRKFVSVRLSTADKIKWSIAGWGLVSVLFRVGVRLTARQDYQSNYRDRDIYDS